MNDWLGKDEKSILHFEQNLDKDRTRVGPDADAFGTASAVLAAFNRNLLGFSGLKISNEKVKKVGAIPLSYHHCPI
jgi:hypothetical protein